jgi:hypothetical protein
MARPRTGSAREPGTQETGVFETYKPGFVARRIAVVFAIETSRKIGWLVDAEVL